MVQGFRLIISDLPHPSSDGKLDQKTDQQIFRYEDPPLSLDQLTHLVQEKLFASQLDASQALLFVGHTGSTRQVLRADDELHSMFKQARGILPSIEVQLPDVRKRLAGFSSDAASVDRRRQDYIEQLEGDNARLLAAWEQTRGRVDELAQLREQDLDENARVLAHQFRQAKTALDECAKSLGVHMEAIDTAHGDMSEKVQRAQQTCDDLSTFCTDLEARVSQVGLELQNNMEDVFGELNKADIRAQGLQDQLRTHQGHLHRHDADVANLDQSKVNVGDFSVTLNYLKERHQACEDDLREKHAALVAEDNRQEENAQALTVRVDAMEVAITNRIDELESSLTELILEKHQEVKSMMGKSSDDFTEEIDTKCAETLERANTRTEHVDKTKKEKLARLKVEVQSGREALAEAQRILRNELTEAATQIHEAIKNLNGKQEATKSELGLTIESLNGTKEETSLQFSEMSLQAQAQNVHSQEGLSAVTRLINSLKDDHLKFKEKMAQHVNMLQHETSNNAEGCHVLEQERKRIVIDNHITTEKITDITDWRSDVDVKLEKLYRYVQPTKVEWKIQKVARKKKELAMPQLLKSQPFNIAGVKGLRFDWYPNGYYGLPAGTCCVRFYAPVGSHIRYECSLGGKTDPPREFKSGDEALWSDHLFGKWDDEVSKDVLVIAVDILANLSEEDGVSSGPLKLEN